MTVTPLPRSAKPPGQQDTPAAASAGQNSGQPGPAPVAVRLRPGDDSAVKSAAVSLLKLQSDMRAAASHAELGFLVANEPRTLLRAQQIIVLSRDRAGRLAVSAVSSMTRVDPASPLVQWFQSLVLALEDDGGLAQHKEFEASAYSTGFDSIRDAYPLRQMLWVPWSSRSGRVVGGMLLARQTPWASADVAIARHVGEAFSHAWLALAADVSWRKLLPRPSPLTLASAAAALALMLLFPVSMAALAPVEVAARNPFLVTSGVEGVVQTVLVAPNETVRKDQVLVQMADTVLKNRLDVAEQEVLLSQARVKRANQQAFVDMKGRHELALAQAELAVKLAERDYARDLFERTQIRADRDGIAVFGDRKDLVGRPVAVGEKLMEIASGDEIELHVDLPVADAIVLKPGARVKVFLDSDPLSPIEARLVRASYQARLTETQQLAFRIVAELPPGSGRQIRLGVRGTAQVYSDSVTLGFYLLRRPIAAARQWFGI